MTPLLTVRGLVKEFSPRRGLFSSAEPVRAVDGVSFDVRHGRTLGLVGESGCGKSTTARCVTRLTEATSGEILFEGRDIRSMSGAALKAFRRDVQIVFQDAKASLNPRLTIGESVGEPLVIHRCGSASRRRGRVEELMEIVGLEPSHLGRFPHELSGGQLQRVGIARALALEPKLIVCDEPVSALDMSVRAQILNLLTRIQDERGIAYLFIAHDLAVARHVSDEIAVMQAGKIVETGLCDDLATRPRHPYTRELFSAAGLAELSAG